jgi:hypothetical protein
MLDELIKEALELPLSDRVWLVEKLLESFSPPKPNNSPKTKIEEEK